MLESSFHCLPPVLFVLCPLAIEGHGLTGGLLLSHLLVEQQREDGHDKKYHEWN